MDSMRFDNILTGFCLANDIEFNKLNIIFNDLGEISNLSPDEMKNDLIDILGSKNFDLALLMVQLYLKHWFEYEAIKYFNNAAEINLVKVELKNIAIFYKFITEISKKLGFFNERNLRLKALKLFFFSTMDTIKSQVDNVIEKIQNNERNINPNELSSYFIHCIIDFYTNEDYLEYYTSKCKIKQDAHNGRDVLRYLNNAIIGSNIMLPWIACILDEQSDESLKENYEVKLEVLFEDYNRLIEFFETCSEHELLDIDRANLAREQLIEIHNLYSTENFDDEEENRQYRTVGDLLIDKEKLNEFNSIIYAYFECIENIMGIEDFDIIEDIITDENKLKMPSAKL